MGRLLAIDYGKRRTGIAVTDELQIIASGLCTIESKNIFSWLKKYTDDNDVELIVIGMPKDLSNRDTNITQTIVKLIEKLKKLHSAIPIVEVDERFTSKMARQSIFDSGVKKIKRRNKELIDEVSATIILQSYMSSQ